LQRPNGCDGRASEAIRFGRARSGVIEDRAASVPQFATVLQKSMSLCVVEFPFPTVARELETDSGVRIGVSMPVVMSWRTPSRCGGLGRRDPSSYVVCFVKADMVISVVQNN
jgi:hypothetical protein